MKIDRATPADLPRLCDLLALLFSQETEFAPDAEAQAAGLNRIIGHPAVGVVLVAREGDALLGLVSLLFTVSTALGGRVALLEDMIVEPLSRGTGVGTRLIEEAVRYARARDCKRITLLTDGDNGAAQRFYARQGVSGSGMMPMRLRLDDSAS